MSSSVQDLRASLSTEQRAVVDAWGMGVAVVAGAGCGKTTTLTIKCAELLRRNPQAKFAAVSFTEKSASDLRAKLSTRLTDLGLVDPANPLAGHWVTTIHGLCASVLREHPREAGLDGEESMLSEPESQALWNRAVDTLWSDRLPQGIAEDLDRLLERESQEVLMEELLPRMRNLEAYGLVDRLEGSAQPLEESLARVGRAILERYQKLKRRRGCLDFNDLERGAAKVLRNPSLRATYHQRFDLVLIDEFQDTNPLQGELLWAFARPDQSNLCVVGDPKQSIYRFRDADVSVFDEYCAKLPGPSGGPLVLTRNFRSRPGIIHAVNDICDPLFQASNLRYDPLEAGRAPSEDTAPVLKLEITDPSELATWLKSEAARGVSLGQFCLLLRTLRNQGRKWLQALTQAGIPIAVSSGGLFWEDPRVRELVAFLKAWSMPGNVLSIVTFLRAPWMGIDDGLIDEWISLDPTLQTPFFGSVHPVAQALAPFRTGKTVRPGELLLALCISDEVEAELGPALIGLWHRCEELSSEGNDLHAVVRELSRAVETGRRERDVPPPRGRGQLTVLTIHGSKGLEFPQVLLVDFPEKPIPHRDYPLLYWDRHRGARLAPRTSTGERDREDGEEIQWREIEKSLALAETKRLFYVAMTRAKERLVLVEVSKPLPSLEGDRPSSPKKTKEKDPEDALGQDFWRGWVALGESRSTVHSPILVTQKVSELGLENADPFLSVNDSTEGRISPRYEFPLRMVRPRHSVTEWATLAHCPRAFSWKVIEKRPGSTEKIQSLKSMQESALHAHETQDSHEEDELSQRELGTRVHACLENRDWDGLRALEGEVGGERFQAIPVIDWADAAPEMQAEDPAQGRRVWNELSFELPVAGEVVVGAIDRLVAPGDQSLCVVDFKVTRKRKSPDELLGNYRTQMELYAWAVGKLEPTSRNRISAKLVAFSKDSVTEIPVPLPASFEELDERISRLAREAADLVAGNTIPQARPGRACRTCEFSSSCDVAGGG